MIKLGVSKDEALQATIHSCSTQTLYQRTYIARQELSDACKSLYQSKWNRCIHDNILTQIQEVQEQNKDIDKEESKGCTTTNWEGRGNIFERQENSLQNQTICVGLCWLSLMKLPLPHHPKNQTTPWWRVAMRMTKQKWRLQFYQMTTSQESSMVTPTIQSRCNLSHFVPWGRFSIVKWRSASSPSSIMPWHTTRSAICLVMVMQVLIW